MPRSALRALLPFALHGLAREVDAAVGVLLHTTLDLPGFVPQALGLLEPGALVRGPLAWTAAGAALWLALAAARAAGRPAGGGSRGERLATALREESAGFAPLYLRPALTLLALGALAVEPTYPYGFTLPVALTQDWGPAQDVAAGAALLAWRRPSLRLPAPGAGSVFFIAWLAYALLSPEAARRWENHPGNEPKTLRMAVAVGHWLTLDTGPVSAAMEELPAAPLRSLPEALRRFAREGGRMAAALLEGPAAVGAGAVRATRITRQVVQGKEGGVYTVLAPGPSVMLAPLLRLDRAWNIRHGVSGRLAFTLLFWNALAAALVAAVFLLVRDATGRPGLAAALAGAFGLLPPSIFYSFQFYPEMLGALGLAISLRLILLVPRWRPHTPWLLGLLLAVMPWLHQKFLPVWLVLAAMAVVRAVDRLDTLRDLAGLLAPQAASALLIALYNFGVTGSVRPDALYLAWGPRGVSGERMGQGLLGLIFDARYGLLPYVPLYLLAFGGLRARGRAARALLWGLPAILAYYLTVASADNWSGAVCNLGRYVMPATPYLTALAGLALARAGGPAALTLALSLLGWSALLGRALWNDPHAANDCALLLAGSAIADGNVYVPNLFLRSWDEAAPGLWARVLAWAALAAGTGAWLGFWARRPGGGSAGRALAGLAAVALGTGFLLERWPGPRTAARFEGLEASPGVAVFPAGDVQVEAGRAHAAGDVRLLVRSRGELAAVRLAVQGPGALAIGGGPAVPLPPREALVDVPLQPLRRLTGRRGLEEWLYTQRLAIDAPRPLLLRAPSPQP